MRHPVMFPALSKLFGLVVRRSPVRAVMESKRTYHIFDTNTQKTVKVMIATREEVQTYVSFRNSGSLNTTRFTFEMECN